VLAISMCLPFQIAAEASITMTKPTDAAVKFIQPRSDEIGLARSENLGYDELRASRLHMLHKEQRPHPKLACEAARDFKSLQK
jgi:hypothetical protein